MASGTAHSDMRRHSALGVILLTNMKTKSWKLLGAVDLPHRIDGQFCRRLTYGLAGRMIQITTIANLNCWLFADENNRHLEITDEITIEQVANKLAAPTPQAL